MKKAVLLAMVACLLSGCLTAIIVASNSNGFPVSKSSIPPSGIYALHDVVVESRKNNIFRLVAAAKEPFTQEQLLAVLWCRASAVAEENNFENWKPMEVARHKSEGYIASEGLIKLTHTPPKPHAKDWCAQVPPEALAPDQPIMHP